MKHYPMRNSNLTLLATASLVISSCCFDCFDSIDSKFIELGFSADSLGGTGFRRGELRSVYAVVYSKPGFQGTVDTMRQTGPFLSSANELIIYTSVPNNQFTFALYAQPKTPFSYRVFVPVTGKTFNIDDVSHTFSEPKRSCKCQYVTEKRFTLNGQMQTQLPANGNNNPVLILPR